MSSKSKKKHNGEWGEWSDWSWNDVRGCLQRTRQHSDGRVNYQYGMVAPSIPASEPKLVDLPSDSREYSSGPVSEVLSYGTLDAALHYPPQWTSPDNFSANFSANFSTQSIPGSSNNEAGPWLSRLGNQSEQGYSRFSFPTEASLHYPFEDPKSSDDRAVDGPNRLPISGSFYGEPLSKGSTKGRHITSSNLSQQEYTTTESPELSKGIENQGLDDKQSDYDTIKNPKGYYKIGRIFKTHPSHPLGANTFVVVREGPNFVICSVPGGEKSEQKKYPVIIENPSITLGSPLQLNPSHLRSVDFTARVQNVGRIDRDYLKILKSTFVNAAKAMDSESMDPFVPSSNSSHITTNNPETQIEPLNPGYQVHRSEEFKKGRVFKILWSEPAGNRTEISDISRTTVVTDDERVYHGNSKYGENAYLSIRRFVIVKVRDGHCMCLPILTYGKQGTAKKGVKANEHAIIYTEKKAPKELENEKKLQKKPIRVIPNTPEDRLAKESRVNYSKLYTIEHNVKVCFIGLVHPDSKGTFEIDFKRSFHDD